MKIFITGTSSFVGKELVKVCQSKGFEVSGCDVNVAENSPFSAMDICSPALSTIIPENVDVIVHLAALSTDKQCRDNGYDCFNVNVMGTLNLIKAAREKKARQFIFASSEWVYGETGNDQIQREEDIIDIQKLNSEYALSKLVSEQNLRQQFSHGFCSTTILRFGIIYGSRANNWSAVEAIFNTVKTKDSVEVGSLKTARRFIHVSDIVSGIMACFKQEGFNLFNLSADQKVTLQEIIEVGATICNKQPIITEKDSQSISIRNPCNARVKAHLDWEPQISLQEGLEQLNRFLDKA